MSNRYYIDTSDDSLGLYVEKINHHKMILVDNVKEISFKYTLTRNKKLADVNAENIIDWSKVIGVHAEIKIIANPPLTEKTWYMYVAAAQ